MVNGQNQQQSKTTLTEEEAETVVGETEADVIVRNPEGEVIGGDEEFIDDAPIDDGGDGGGDDDTDGGGDDGDTDQQQEQQQQTRTEALTTTRNQLQDLRLTLSEAQDIAQQNPGQTVELDGQQTTATEAVEQLKETKQSLEQRQEKLRTASLDPDATAFAAPDLPGGIGIIRDAPQQPITEPLGDPRTELEQQTEIGRLPEPETERQEQIKEQVGRVRTFEETGPGITPEERQIVEAGKQDIQRAELEQQQQQIQEAPEEARFQIEAGQRNIQLTREEAESLVESRQQRLERQPTAEERRQQRSEQVEVEQLSGPELSQRFFQETGELAAVGAADVGFETAETVASTVTGSDIDVVEPRGREQFEETLPELSEMQRRTTGTVRQTFQGERQEPGVGQDISQAALQISEQTFSPLLGQTPDIPTDPQTQQFLAEATAQEVPEKIIETPTLLAISGETLDDPGQVGLTAVRGSTEFIERTIEEPVEFGVAETVPDIALDISTGSIVGGITPTPQTQVQQQAPPTVQDLQLQRFSTRPEPQVEATTAPPSQVNQVAATPEQATAPGQTLTQPKPLPDFVVQQQTVDTVQPEPLPEAAAVTQATVQPLTESGDLVRPATDTEPVTRPSERVGQVTQPEQVTVPENVVQPLTESVAVPQEQAQVQAQVQERPQVQAQAVPQVRTLPVVTPELDDDRRQVDEVFGGDEAGGRGAARRPSLGSIFAGETVEESEAQQRFTGLEQRPVVVDDNGENEPRENDLEQDIQDLF